MGFDGYEVQLVDADGRYEFRIPALGIVGSGPDVQSAFDDLEARKKSFREIVRTVGMPPHAEARMVAAPASNYRPRSVVGELAVFVLKLAIFFFLLWGMAPYAIKSIRSLEGDAIGLLIGIRPIDTVVTIGNIIRETPEQRMASFQSSLALIHQAVMVPLTTGVVGIPRAPAPASDGKKKAGPQN